MKWAEPDPTRRPKTLARVFRGMLAYAEHVGGHFYEPGVGSVHWRDGAHAHMGPLATATSGLWRVALVAPPGVWLRLSGHEDEAMARVQRHLGPGAVYLCTLGVEPSQAGKGHGSRLLKRAFNEQARRWQTCVLRTEQPRNVPFYLKSGFTQIDEFVASTSGLRTWVFSRPLLAEA
jgi:GNAT superfamily N-acetyltransferase